MAKKKKLLVTDRPALLRKYGKASEGAIDDLLRQAPQWLAHDEYEVRLEDLDLSDAGEEVRRQNALEKIRALCKAFGTDDALVLLGDKDIIPYQLIKGIRYPGHLDIVDSQGVVETDISYASCCAPPEFDNTYQNNLKRLKDWHPSHMVGRLPDPPKGHQGGVATYASCLRQHASLQQVFLIKNVAENFFLLYLRSWQDPTIRILSRSLHIFSWKTHSVCHEGYNQCPSGKRPLHIINVHGEPNNKRFLFSKNTVAATVSLVQQLSEPGIACILCCHGGVLGDGSIASAYSLKPGAMLFGSTMKTFYDKRGYCRYSDLFFACLLTHFVLPGGRAGDALSKAYRDYLAVLSVDETFADQGNGCDYATVLQFNYVGDPTVHVGIEPAAGQGGIRQILPKLTSIFRQRSPSNDASVGVKG